MEPATAFVTVGKLIALGIKGWKALDHHGFGKEDLEALQAFLESGASAMHKSEASSAAALQLAMIARAFGRAVGRHQMFHGMVSIRGHVWRWLDQDERKREREIELRVKVAMLRVPELGNDSVGEIARIDALTGDPIGTPYYRALWQAFSDPALTIEEIGESPPLVVSNTARREFERYFLLAYLDSLATSGGAIEPYLEGLARYRRLLIRDLLARDLAAWGGRHVFGNVPRERWDDDEAVPFLPLERIYVEPDGVLVRDGQPQPSEPLLALIERLTEPSAEPRVVVVTADFGSGKSLSARMLARRWAEQRLTSPGVSLDVPLPIYVRCADDFPSETVDLELTVRRAWKRQVDGIGHSVADDDESFAWPSPEQRMVCLLDGLDEVSLGEQHLQTLFQKLRGKTTRNHHFVIFSRPGALPAQRDLGPNVVVVHVQPFGPGQIEQWLARWNSLHSDDPPITWEDLAERDLAEIVRTPILLFMVAFTWGDETTKSWPPSIAEIYERFFHQVASGKAGADPDPHRPIAIASDRLLAALQNAGLLDVDAERSDAMLWLMGRVAWEAHNFEQRHPPEPLTRWHVDSMLRDGEVPIPPDAVDAIRIGLVLTLQADLHGANHTILFGHQSFREFLVGRHWATTLRRFVRSRNGNDPRITASLLGGRLLGYEDKSFDYLMRFINAAEDGHSRSASPMGWSDDERKRLVRWAQETFNDERQEFGERARPRRRADATIYNDQRAVLREAALAIGSMTRDSDGMRANHRHTLRSMLAWFWLNSDVAIVIAPEAALMGTHLRGADLRQAYLRGAILHGAELIAADLSRAILHEADLHEANLYEADLSGANLSGADLRQAILHEANLCGAILHGADLREADLSGADLSGAELIAADLSGADLGGARFNQANLRRAKFCRANLAKAKIREANLADADFNGANLSQTDFTWTRVKQSDSRMFSNVVYDATTVWPDGFDPSTIGADGSGDVA